MPLYAFQISDFSEEVARNIHERIEYGKYVSIMVGIVDTAGPRYYSYGTVSPTSNKTPDENSVYEIGSITKVFTTILLADLVQKGELRLDDPIERFLPDNVETPTRNGYSIRLAHLATHTSELARMPDNFAPKTQATRGQIIQYLNYMQPFRVWGLSTHVFLIAKIE